MHQLINRGYYHGRFALTKVISDFESSLLPAVRAIYPQAIQRGCYFHFGQAVYRKIQEMGYSVRYRNDPEFKNRCHMLIALGFVPVADKV